MPENYAQLCVYNVLKYVSSTLSIYLALCHRYFYIIRLLPAYYRGEYLQSWDDDGRSLDAKKRAQMVIQVVECQYKTSTRSEQSLHHFYSILSADNNCSIWSFLICSYSI